MVQDSKQEENLVGRLRKGFMEELTFKMILKEGQIKNVSGKENSRQREQRRQREWRQ